MARAYCMVKGAHAANKLKSEYWKCRVACYSILNVCSLLVDLSNLCSVI